MKTLLLWSVIMTAVSCGGQPAPFERVDKLRALGVAVDPIISEPSTAENRSMANLTFHLLVPVDQEIKADAFLDEDSLFDIPLEVEVDDSSANYEDFSMLRHYTVNAAMAIPTADQLKFTGEQGAARLRYSVRFTSGGEEEKVVGTVLVMPDGESAEFEPLDIEITKPKASDLLPNEGDQDIEAEVTNENDEPLKIGWFVSHGRLENRRAVETKWETGDAEQQLLVATVRGKRSRSFAVKFRELETKK